jgi:DNA-binding PadR family transcriptional regulator
MANTINIRQLILGFLTQQPMSGYDIKRFLKGLSWLIDSPSFGSLYPALHTLLKDGHVTVEIVPQQDKPRRKIYTITDKGSETLQDWIDQPAASGVSLKAFLMRLILAGNLSEAHLTAQLKQRRTQVSAHLQRTADALQKDVGPGERLALDYGLAVANAELAWLDNVLGRLSKDTEDT